jgi:hypothetical protein
MHDPGIWQAIDKNKIKYYQIHIIGTPSYIILWLLENVVWQWSDILGAWCLQITYNCSCDTNKRYMLLIEHHICAWTLQTTLSLKYLFAKKYQSHQSLVSIAECNIYIFHTWSRSSYGIVIMDMIHFVTAHMCVIQQSAVGDKQAVSRINLIMDKYVQMMYRQYNTRLCVGHCLTKTKQYQRFQPQIKY